MIDFVFNAFFKTPEKCKNLHKTNQEKQKAEKTKLYFVVLIIIFVYILRNPYAFESKLQGDGWLYKIIKRKNGK